MKKVGALAIVVFLVFLLAPLALADNHTNETNTSTSGGSVEQQQDQGSKTEEAYQCLEERVGNCAGLSVQEIALTIMATPDDETFDSCVDALKDKRSSNNWGNVRDTALGILALDHAGEDTQASEEWLLEQTRTPTDLIWYMEQDSNEQVQCNIGYNSQDYSVTIGEDKKIKNNAGSCLQRAQSLGSFWFEISPDCYENDFNVECDKDFIATLLYKNRDSPTIYVLEGTESSPAYGTITLSVNSKCFGTNSCDYEGSIWATVALLRTGHDVEEYLPYIIALSDTNEQYLPNAFVYMATNYEDYADDLVGEVKLGNFWLADRSAYNKYYDTSLAILSLGTSSSSEQVTKAKDWLLFSQGENGCWQNSVRETAIVLWALEGRSGRAHGGGGGGVTLCSEASFFCIPNAECPASEDVGNNYFCSSLSETCCTTENLKSCSAMGGSVCSADMVCTGNERKATDTDACCTGECVEKPQQTECEQFYYTCMDSSCSDAQEPVAGYSCNVGQVCCRAQTSPGTPDDPKGSLLWLWILLGILILLLILAIIFRKKLQAWFNSKKSSKKGAGSSKPSSGPGPRPGMVPPRRGPPRRPMPPRRGPSKPGFPPVRRQGPPVASKRSYDKRDPEMSDTFKKLREMSG